MPVEVKKKTEAAPAAIPAAIPAAKKPKLSAAMQETHKRNIAKMQEIEKARKDHNVYQIGAQTEMLLAEIVVGVRKGAMYDQTTGVLTVPKA